MPRNRYKIFYSLVACAGRECGFCDLLKVAENIFFWLLSVTFALAVLFVILSGFIYLFSLGKPGQIEKAKTAARFTIVGFAVCLLSWLLIHSLYGFLGYKSDSWWRIECDSQDTTQTTELPAVADPYANEISVNNLGGRNNPVALPDLANAGLASLPENKYIFIHGLGGQPLEQAAAQLTKLVSEAKSNRKVVYAVKPFYVDPETGEVTDSRLENLNRYINPDFNQTARDTTTQNFENWLIRYVLESESMEIPLGIFDERLANIPSFNDDAWSQISNFAGPGLSSIDQSGVLRSEGASLEDKILGDRADYLESAESSPWNVNLSSFYSEGVAYPEFYLNIEQPLTFNFAPNVNEDSAEEAAEEIAIIVAKTAKTAGNTKDDWFKLNELMAKESLPGENYDPGIFPHAVATGSSQRGEAENEKFNRRLEEKAGKIIQDELGDYFSDTAPHASSLAGVAQEKTPMASESSPPPVPVQPPSAAAPVASGSIDESLNFYKVASLEGYSLTPGGINTDQILSLAQREELYKLVQGIQKEEANNMGKNMNIPPAFVMCVMALESKFDVAAGKKGSTHVGLGQMGIKETKGGLEELKKNAPEHYKALADKIQKNYGVDMEDTFMGKQTKEKKETKLKITRSDPEFAAATTTGWIQKLGAEKRGGKNLRGIADAYGDTNYPTDWILRCTENNGWRQNQAWVKAKLGW